MPHMKASMHHIIDTWIDIEAKTQKVWELLVDFPAWASKSPHQSE